MRANMLASLAFGRLRRFGHRLGDTSEDVDFLLVQLSAVEHLVQARHQLLGRGWLKVANVHQGLLPMRKHAADLARVGET